MLILKMLLKIQQLHVIELKRRQCLFIKAQNLKWIIFFHTILLVTINHIYSF